MSLLHKVWKLIPKKIRDYIKALIILPINKLRDNFFKLRVWPYSKKNVFFCNSAKGKRCFIIGNGPSLTIDDLNNLISEDCFATNRIYKLFCNTDWRPKYYCCQDEVLLDFMKGEFEKEIEKCGTVFLSGWALKKNKVKNKNYNYFYLNKGPFKYDIPPFSEDITTQIYEGYTVLYACIQIAVYMGYKEIYLLGVDHNYTLKNTKINTHVLDSSKSYAAGLETDMASLNLPQLDKSQKAYEVAKKYCDDNHIMIKNATRGGNLNVFERINIEEILMN